MTGMRDGVSDPRLEAPATADGAPSTGVAAGTVRLLVVDADAALFGLLDEWLSAAGCKLARARTGDLVAQGRFDLVVIDVPFPRQTGLDAVRRYEP